MKVKLINGEMRKKNNLFTLIIPKIRENERLIPDLNIGDRVRWNNIVHIVTFICRYEDGGGSITIENTKNGKLECFASVVTIGKVP